ncbi:BsaWI family type II restriction enzyme [Aureisphaera galaxeae]|uniref:BsaWI family type II restriction enzyme n=1 Tax=Aureisphaera galaxeae TaxID=1538023 RepID=UPI0023510602|nr:BsaWI family type II restriction enzyme [Aureisphaera galaxeae]MDC8005544.1 BsaWI family type II restriction enzyme [Aureisphaera galaxeae]
MLNFKKYCVNEYKRIFNLEYESSELKKSEDKRKFAQKKAIKTASINAMKSFPKVEPSDIWKTIYLSHVNNFSGIIDQEIIKKVISADNSWKKSSGHAFEEMIRDIGNLHLSNHGIKILLQKELSYELHNDNIINEVRDISWLNEQISTSIFDLYLAIEREEGFLIFGCIQSKTSIRDRVTRDREPSINAMKAFFVSFAIVLDGDFMRLPKFKNMVNGNSPEFKINGWHGMYILTNSDIENDRIKAIDINMESFVKDCVTSSEYWINHRQWLDYSWRP